jgi:uncharacterized protein (TIGR02145 family)
MKSKFINGFLTLLILVLVTSCKSEKQKFSELLVSKDLKMAYEFQSEYPKSTYQIDSLIQALEYQKVLDTPNIEGFKNFLKKFPNTPYQKTIKLQLSELEWNKICMIFSKSMFDSNKEDVNKFYTEYPDSPHHEHAELLLLKYENNGTFTDKRDGQKYSWVRIGDQVWMTQNLNFNTQYACQCFNEHKQTIIEAGRAYVYDMIWDASPEGWEIPTLEDWYTMIFELGGSLRIIIFPEYGQISAHIAAEYMSNRFQPYLGFRYSDYDERSNSCGRFATDGAEYWTKTTLLGNNNWNNKIYPSVIGWRPNSENIPRVATIDIGGMFDVAHPIRCINKLTSASSNRTQAMSIVPNKSDNIIIDNAEYKIKDLPIEGIYEQQTEKSEEFPNKIIIKYIGEKMFFLLEDSKVMNEFHNFPITYSKENQNFTFSKTIFGERKVDAGKFKSENNNASIELYQYEQFQNKSQKYRLIPKLKFQF